MIKTVLVDAGGVFYLKDKNNQGYINPELLEFIRRNQGKYKFGIISTTNYDLDQILHYDNVHDLFDVVLTSGTTGLDKNQPQIYQLALDQLNTKANETLLIDNSDDYIKAASSLGINTILYETASSLNSALKKLGLTH